MGNKWNLTDNQNFEKSKRMKGHTVSEETRQKLREVSLGKVATEETRKKQSDTLKGKKKSELTKQHMREAAARRDPSTYDKIAEALRGRTLSPEHIQAQRESKKLAGTWKEIGYTFIRRGYRWVKIGEGNGRANYVAEHRLVVSTHIGRPLLSTEHVHHLDGDTLNNNIDNLALISRKDHSLLNKLLRIVDADMAKIIIDTLIQRFPNLGFENSNQNACAKNSMRQDLNKK